MSFTTDIKAELCRLPHAKPCCILAELYGALLYGAQFSMSKIKLQADAPFVRKRLQTLLESAAGVQISSNEENPRAIAVDSAEDIKKIFTAFGYEYSDAPLHLNRAVVDEECCKWSFVRGTFLVGGSANGAGKGYHLEFSGSHYNVAREFAIMLTEMGTKCGMVERRGNFVIYYKNSTAIEEIITSMGASSSAMNIMLKKVEKDFINNINRKVNCETANLTKTVDAAAKQTRAIEILKQSGVLESLPEMLKKTAKIRLEHPENSLTELLQYFDEPITKPGLNNRMRKLVKLSEKK